MRLAEGTVSFTRHHNHSEVPSVVRTNASTIDTSFTGVAHLLRDRQLEVPAYQRSYSWTEDEVSAYWHDLRAAMVSDQPIYFLGTVVSRVAQTTEVP